MSSINIKNPKFIPKLKVRKNTSSNGTEGTIIQNFNSNIQIHSPKIKYTNFQSYPPTNFQKNQEEKKIIDNAFIKPNTSQNRWTKEEDEQLMQIVNRIGPKQWRQVASLMKTKTAKQCRDHYTNCLDPEIKSSYWSNEEEKILLSKYEQFGPRWSLIKNYLPGRTTLMIKNYVKMLLKKNGDLFPKKIEFKSGENSSDESEEESKEIEKNEKAVCDINYLLNRPLTFNAYV